MNKRRVATALCFLAGVFFPIQIEASANEDILPFGTNLTENIKVYESLTKEQDQKPAHFIPMKESMIESMKERIKSIKSMKEQLVRQAQIQNDLVAEAYVRFLCADALVRLDEELIAQLDEELHEMMPISAFSEYKRALELLFQVESKQLEKSHQGEIRVVKLYQQVLDAILTLQRQRAAERPGEPVFESWVKGYLTDTRFSKSGLYRRSLERVKCAQADFTFERGDYARARTYYKELLIAFPDTPEFSRIRGRLKEIEKEFNPQDYERFLKSRKHAVYASIIVSICLVLLLLLIDRRCPELRIWRGKQEMLREKVRLLYGRLSRYLKNQKIRVTGEKEGIHEVFESINLLYNDPLSYFIERRTPTLLSIFFFCFVAMFVFHFVVAFLDNNLCIRQGDVNFFSAVFSGNFGNIRSTCLTIPRGYSESQMEYFFNDYYGLLVNGFINPLSFTVIIVIYRRFVRVWNTLLKEEIIQPLDRESALEICEYLVRIFNKRLYFWFSFILPLLITFWMWYGVSNQPDRASYLDFDQGIMPIFHGLYLATMWYMLSMATIKAIVSIMVINKFCNKFVDQKKIGLALGPLHPDGCAGLATLGHYALLLHLIIFLQGVSVSTRVFFDFVMVGTSILKQPQVLLGVVAIIIIGPILFFVPLYLVRGRIITVKRRMLKEFNEVYAIQRDKFMKLLQRKKSAAESLELEILEYMERVSELYKPVANIPNWPFDFRTISAFVGTLFVPIIVSLLIEVFRSMLL